MNAAWLPLTALTTSLLVVVIIFALPEDARRLRTTLNLVAAVVKIVLVMMMVRRVAAGHEDIFSFQVVGGVDFVLHCWRLCGAGYWPGVPIHLKPWWLLLP